MGVVQGVPQLASVLLMGAVTNSWSNYEQAAAMTMSCVSLLHEAAVACDLLCCADNLSRGGARDMVHRGTPRSPLQQLGAPLLPAPGTSTKPRGLPTARHNGKTSDTNPYHVGHDPASHDAQRGANDGPSASTAVSEFLRGLGLGQHVASFAAAGMTMDLLTDAAAAEWYELSHLLEECGMRRVGDRQRVRRALKQVPK